MALGVVLGAAIFHAPLLALIPEALIHEDPEKEGDAIVVLAGDSGERVERAVELWKKGRSRSGLFVVSGGPLYHKTTWAELMAAHARELGVPEEKVLLQAVSRTTGEDASETLKLLEGRGVKSIVLVTSAWHSKRARRRFVELAPGVEVISCPAARPVIEGGWWRDAVAARAVVTEVLKWLWPGPG